MVTLCITRFNIENIVAHKVHLNILYGSKNKEKLFPYTALTDWVYQPTRSVFTAR
jgi:hypothetical protein